MGQVNRILQQIRDMENVSAITTIAMPSLPNLWGSTTHWNSHEQPSLQLHAHLLSHQLMSSPLSIILHCSKSFVVYTYRLLLEPLAFTIDCLSIRPSVEYIYGKRHRESQHSSSRESACNQRELKWHGLLLCTSCYMCRLLNV